MNIDRIARAMVDVEPSADLEARIRARLGAARPARGTAWWSWRIAVPMGVVTAALLVGVQVSRSPGVVNPIGVPASRGPEVVTSQLPNVSTSRPSEVTSQLPRFPTSPLAGVSPPQLSPEEIAWMERRMPALDPVNALQMDRLHMDSIQPEPLAITPLTITPVNTEGAGTERSNSR